MSTAHRYSDVSRSACPIVFVHGSLSSRRIWAPYTAAFGTRETIAIDLPGYGEEAACPGSSPYRLSNGAAILRRSIEGRSKPVDVVAHSFGAAVALRFALEDHARVRTLTVVEPTLFRLLRDLGPRAGDALRGIERIARGFTPSGSDQTACSASHASSTTGMELARGLRFPPNARRCLLSNLIRCGETSRQSSLSVYVCRRSES